MVATGPIFAEQKDFAAHVPLRNQMAALERAIADELNHRGYKVLGKHPRSGLLDSTFLQEVMALLETDFPSVLAD